MRVEGMDWSALRLGGDGGFDIAGLKQEEIVTGLKAGIEACIQPAQVKCRL